jgi:hypothetical protein
MSDFYARYLERVRVLVEADPDLQLAKSLQSFSFGADAHDAGEDLVREHVKGIDPDTLPEAERDDVRRLQKAWAILGGRQLISGVDFGNLSINVHDAGGNFPGEGETGPAREIIGRVAAANPELAEEITSRGPVIPY